MKTIGFSFATTHSLDVSWRGANIQADNLPLEVLLAAPLQLKAIFT